MAPGEPILLICYSFPPNSGIGGRRWAKFAKELASRGHPVHVIRSAGTKGKLDSLWNEDAMHPNIISHPLPARYPAVMSRWPITSLWDKLMYRIWLRILPLFTKGNWYDAALFWKGPMLRMAEKLITEHGIRNVVVTGAPFSLMAYATELKERFPQLNLVADFRDSWTWSKDYGLGSIGPERLRQERLKEAHVLHVFDKLISPHATVIEHLRQTYHGQDTRYAVIPHAIDPDDLYAASPKEDDGRFKMIYAGSLYGAQEAQAYFDALLRAFLMLREKHARVFALCRLDLYITGQGTESYQDQVRDLGLEENIIFQDRLPPKEIIKRIAQADLVLAFIPSMNKDVLGTKFNEVFMLRRPILHVGEPGLVGRTIVDRKLGDSISVKELVEELPRIITGERKIDVDINADHREFMLATITDRLIRDVFV